MSATAAMHDYLIADEAVVDDARWDPITFIDYVMKDEEAGGPTLSCAMHREWQRKLGKHRNVILISHIESGKTMAIAVGRVLWELGRNPDLRVAIAANTSGQAAKLVTIIGRYIQQSEELHRVFPNLVPDPGGPWNSTALAVRRSGPSKDASVQAVGVHGSVLGSRVDLLVVDDIVDAENSNTVGKRDDLDRWVRSTLLGRLTGNARVWILGNCWHRDDLLARLEQTGQWPTFRYPVTGLFGRSRWPQKWSATRIEATRKILGPGEAGRQLDCIPGDESDPVFPGEWIDAALKRGENATTEHFASAAEPDSVIVVGVDVATSLRQTADESALVLTRTSRATGLREVTQVKAGRWLLDPLANEIVMTCKINRALAAIEVNGPGEHVAQVVERAIPVVRLHTSQVSKRARVEMLGSELASGRWSFRQPGFLDDQMRRLTHELRSFSFEEHTGDRLAGLLVAVEAIRQREQRPVGGVIQWGINRR